MQLRNIMTPGIVAIGADETAGAARDRMKRHRIRHLAVLEGGLLAGIVSERDLGATRDTDRPVREVMNSDVVSATPATTTRQAANLMRGHTIGSLLVVDGGELKGIVTTTDLLDQLGRGATRPTVRTESPPARRPPASGVVQGRLAARATGTRRGRRPRRTSSQRSPLPGSLPRPVKLSRDRSSAVLPPAHVRVLGARLSDVDRDHIRKKLGASFGRFASSVERLTVRLSDVNGPKGGRDQVCKIKVVLSGLPSVIVERRDATLQGATDAAIRAAALAVRRRVQRRRLKPLRGRSAQSRAS